MCLSREKSEERTPPDLTTIPAPNYPNTSSSTASEQNAPVAEAPLVDSAYDRDQKVVSPYERTEKVWDDMRSNEDKNIGKTVHLERLEVMDSYSSIQSDVRAYTKALHYVSITDHSGSYSTEMEVNNPNFIKLHDDDRIDVTGTFTGVNSSGEVVIELTKIKNLGIHPDNPLVKQP